MEPAFILDFMREVVIVSRLSPSECILIWVKVAVESKLSVLLILSSRARLLHATGSFADLRNSSCP